MTVDQALLIGGALAFVLEAFDIALGTLRPKWWALGVMFWLLAQAF
jgi:hypothetical protein